MWGRRKPKSQLKVQTVEEYRRVRQEQALRSRGPFIASASHRAAVTLYRRDEADYMFVGHLVEAGFWNTGVMEPAVILSRDLTVDELGRVLLDELARPTWVEFAMNVPRPKSKRPVLRQAVSPVGVSSFDLPCSSAPAVTRMTTTSTRGHAM